MGDINSVTYHARLSVIEDHVVVDLLQVSWQSEIAVILPAHGGIQLRNWSYNLRAQHPDAQIFVFQIPIFLDNGM